MKRMRGAFFKKCRNNVFWDISTEISAYLDKMTWLQINLLSLLLYYLIAIGAQIQSLKFSIGIVKKRRLFASEIDD